MSAQPTASTAPSSSSSGMSTLPNHATTITSSSSPHHAEDNSNNTATTAATNSPPDPTATAASRTAFLASLSSAAHSLDGQLTARAQTLHGNGAALQRQQADVEKATHALRKQGDRFAREVERSARGLKEIGDVQNWAEMIERDLFVVEETLRMAEERAVVVGEGINGAK